jgi:DNA-binding winged helix-turn-helix (wHTH) protein
MAAMLSSEQCAEIIDAGELPYLDAFTLDCQVNQLTLHACRRELPLSEAQKRLLVCLIKGINCKRKIINIVWHENHKRISDNNYHQLVFQLRALFKQHQLPGQLALTVPYYGLKLNEPLLKTLGQSQRKDHAVTPKPHDDNNNGDSVEGSPSLLARLIHLGRSFFMISLLVLV